MDIFHNPEPIEVDRETWNRMEIIEQKEIIRKAELLLSMNYPHNPNESNTTIAEIERIYKTIKTAKAKLILLGVKQ